MALTLGVDFNCNASICYGIGAQNHALFQQLQQVLNQYGAGLAVDGFIGANTVNAVRTIANQRGLTIAGTTKESIAASADAIIAQLQHAIVATGEMPPEIESAVQQALNACRFDKSSPTCANAKTLCKTVRGTASAKLPGINELCATRLPLWARWTVGLTAVAGLAVGGVVAYRHHRRTR